MLFLKNFKDLSKHFLKAELANLERLLSPILFSATILILFYFSLGEVSSEERAKVFVAQMFLTAFFALQISFTRIFDPEEQDDAFTLMRSYNISPEAWFLAKYTVVMLFGCIVLLSTIFLSTFFNSSLIDADQLPEIMLIALLSILGLAALGILLAAMVSKASSKNILFPLIYFPLTAPVLLAATQSALGILEKGYNIGELMQSWLGLLIIFDVVYITLSLLLFGELVKKE